MVGGLHQRYICHATRATTTTLGIERRKPLRIDRVVLFTAWLWRTSCDSIGFTLPLLTAIRSYAWRLALS